MPFRRRRHLLIAALMVSGLVGCAPAGATTPGRFYAQSWFLLLALALPTALILAGLLIAGQRLRTRNIASRNRELAQQVSERTTEIERRRQIAEGLREILVILNSNRSQAESLHYIVTQAARLTDAEDAIIFRLAADQPLTIVATNPGGQIRYTPGPALLALTKDWIQFGLPDKEPLTIPDLQRHWTAYLADARASLGNHQALLGIPLFLGSDIYGGLLLFYTAERDFSAEDLELGFTFADQAALAIANERLRRQAERSAVAEERNRLARDLHDAVTQTLFSASLIAEALPEMWNEDPAEGQQLLDELGRLTRGALAEMRTLLLELRPAGLAEAKLPDLLRQLTEANTGRAGIPITLDIDFTDNLSVPVREALYRLVQEGLNNVVKHARASQAAVTLHNSPAGTGLTLTIHDNGRSFEPDQVPAGHLGLTIMKERAAAIAADLTIDTRPGQGTTITVHWPAAAPPPAGRQPEVTYEHEQTNPRPPR